MEYKVCTKCKKELQATTEYFRKSKNGKYGVDSVCKECKREIYKENREIILKKQKKYYEENKDKKQQKKEYHKQWVIKNKERVREYQKQYREENIEKFKQYRKENAERIRKNNIQWNKKYKKKYYRDNKEKYLIQNKKWELKNKNKVNMKYQRYRAKKRSLANTLTEEQWIEIRNKFNNRCAYCGKKTRLEQEHFVPLSKGGEYTSNNIIPACRSCNASKKDNDFFEWYPQQDFYSFKNEKSILIFLGYKDNKQ